MMYYADIINLQKLSIASIGGKTKSIVLLVRKPVNCSDLVYLEAVVLFSFLTFMMDLAVTYLQRYLTI